MQGVGCAPNGKNNVCSPSPDVVYEQCRPLHLVPTAEITQHVHRGGHAPQAIKVGGAGEAGRRQRRQLSRRQNLAAVTAAAAEWQQEGDIVAVDGYDGGWWCMLS
jgi:hypothetical protein